METSSVLRRFSVCALAALLLAGAWARRPTAFAAQDNSAQKKEDAKKKEQPKKPAEPQVAKFDKNNPTAEQVAELVIFAFGSRAGLAQIRRTGVERGKITRTTDDGRPEEISYERTFKRGETFDKDKIRLDQRMPSTEYSLTDSGGKVYGRLLGSTLTPHHRTIAPL